mmetsp:Transcript_10219/g.32502  ORF Transcript_10219/g.32502 Transcript_10219/m.32502 type:complete len:236 (+) Transcript_10219:1143-1850(+)
MQIPWLWRVGCLRTSGRRHSGWCASSGCSTPRTTRVPSEFMRKPCSKSLADGLLRVRVRRLEYTAVAACAISCSAGDNRSRTTEASAKRVAPLLAGFETQYSAVQALTPSECHSAPVRHSRAPCAVPSLRTRIVATRRASAAALCGSWPRASESSRATSLASCVASSGAAAQGWPEPARRTRTAPRRCTSRTSAARHSGLSSSSAAVCWPPHSQTCIFSRHCGLVVHHLRIGDWT